MRSRSAESAALHVVRPTAAWGLPSFREVWQFRELAYCLVWREIKVRYKQTALGAAWAVVQPFFTMVVFSTFFGRLGRLPSENLPYPLFAYCALLPWQLFAFVVAEASSSVVANQRLITKVYFPRLILPIVAVAVGVVDFGIAFAILVLMMGYYGVSPSLAMWTLPVWLLLAVAAALGAGLWLAALNVRYRDVRYTVPLLIQLWLFASPVAYPIAIVPPSWRTLYALNPMVGVIEGFRWALLGTRGVSLPVAAVSAAAVAAAVVGGLVYFRRTERVFADLV